MQIMTPFYATSINDEKFIETAFVEHKLMNSAMTFGSLQEYKVLEIIIIFS